MKPESGTCRECKIFNDHYIIERTYVCSNCRFVTRIPTWEECEQKLKEIEQAWLEIKRNHPDFFIPELLNDASNQLSQVEIVTKKKPGLN